MIQSNTSVIFIFITNWTIGLLEFKCFRFCYLYINSLKFFMFSKIKSIFKKENNPEAGSEPFKHPDISKQDATECPFMKKQVKGKGKENKKAANSDTESEEEEKPRGGCPFMQSTGTKKNPNLGLVHQGYDEPFVSKFKFYLSSNKLNFQAINRGKSQGQPSREVFNTYPIYLKHTLFYNGEDFQKVRSMECCSRFLAYQELREKGNKYFNKGKYEKSLDYYERAMSLFRWLDYKQPQPLNEAPSEFCLSQVPSQSQMSEENEMGSKIKLNVESNEFSSFAKENDKQFAELKSKYKQFFVIYSDENVVACEGEELTEKVDTDMRKSLLIQIYLNMAAAYIHLNHFSLAHEILMDALNLSDKVSQIYLRLSQVAQSNLSAKLSDLQQAQQWINKAITSFPEQKIFKNTNPNILKMLNIHDAQEVYNEVSLKLNERITAVTEKQKQLKLKFEDRLQFINRIEQQMLAEGKQPKQSGNPQLMSNTTDYKILMRIYDKYVRIMEFYIEAKDKNQVNLAKKQFQQVLRVLTEIKFVENIEINPLETRFGVNEIKVYNRISNLKRQKCEQIYNGARYNFNVLEWAIKQIVDEEEVVRQAQIKREKARKQEQAQQKGEDPQKQIHNKQNWSSKMPYAIVIMPIIGIAINYLIF